MTRADQETFAAHSQANWAAAQDAGAFSHELIPISIQQRKGDPSTVDTDEHPRPGITVEKLAKLKGINGAERSATAGNASGINDGAAALLLASKTTVRAKGLSPMAYVVEMASAGVAPRITGIGPVPAVRKLLDRTGVSLGDIDIIELNEDFASQGLAVLRDLGLADDDPRVTPRGGAIAMGHRLGMKDKRIVLSTAHQLRKSGKRFALCTMCVAVAQGTASLLERA